MWFKLGPTNHDPKVIARNYLEAVEKANGIKNWFIATYHPFLCVLYLTGCPMVVRADYGTENCVVAKIQIAFCMNHPDSLSGQRSFFYGPSTANSVCC